jgi:hypothetical protein
MLFVWKKEPLVQGISQENQASDSKYKISTCCNNSFATEKELWEIVQCSLYDASQNWQNTWKLVCRSAVEQVVWSIEARSVLLRETVHMRVWYVPGTLVRDSFSATALYFKHEILVSYWHFYMKSFEVTC